MSRCSDRATFTLGRSAYSPSSDRHDLTRGLRFRQVRGGQSGTLPSLFECRSTVKHGTASLRCDDVTRPPRAERRSQRRRVDDSDMNRPTMQGKATTEQMLLVTIAACVAIAAMVAAIAVLL